MRPLRYSINVTLDGCCDHRAIPADEELHRHAIENLDQADALLFGRVTYQMMEAACRPSARTESDACLDGTLRPDDRRGKEVRLRVRAGKDGKFRIDGLSRGLKYAVSVVKDPGYGLEVSGKDIRDITIKPGETRDLGDVQMKPME